jgi:hypothetical protein
MLSRDKKCALRRAVLSRSSTSAGHTGPPKTSAVGGDLPVAPEDLHLSRGEVYVDGGDLGLTCTAGAGQYHRCDEIP